MEQFNLDFKYIKGCGNRKRAEDFCCLLFGLWGAYQGMEKAKESC